MINDDTLTSIAPEIHTLEILWWNAGKIKCRVRLKPKAGIIARIAQNDTSRRTKRLYLVETGFYKPNADPLSLSVRPYGNWAEATTSGDTVTDPDWREGDMANNLTVLFCHQGKSQSACFSKGINDGSFGPVTVLSTVKRRGDQRLDVFDVVGMLWSYNHGRSVAIAARFAKTKLFG